MVKFIAFYLPQFHPSDQNDKWWGKGFTEWRTVTTAKSLYRGHHQPNIPRDLGFYDLRLPEVRSEQAKLAAEYGVDAFCYWHYWFGDGKRLLDLPFKEVLRLKKPNFPFCLAWANHSWYKKNWGGKGKDELLIEQTYPGVDDYIAHFYEMLPAFKDDRYIKVGNKLFFIIYDPLASSEISLFIETWRKLAKENGINDFYFVGKDSDSRHKEKILSVGCNAIYNDNVFRIHRKQPKYSKALYLLKRKLLKLPTVFNYKDAIDYMITEEEAKENVLPVIAPNWDHSPRSGAKNIILHKSHPKYFRKVVEIAMNVVKNKSKENQIVLIKSWNEWGEGNYLEPDLQFGLGMLQELKSVKEKNTNKNA